MQTYNFALSAFTASGGNVAPAVLMDELEIAFGVKPHSISTGASVDIVFENSVNATTLGNAVAAHGGVEDAPVIKLVEELTVDKATTSTSFMDLLTKTLVCKAGSYAVVASYSMANSIRGSEAYFQLVVDGVVKRGGKQCAAEFGAGGSGSLASKVTLARGQHTVKLQWRVSKGAGSIRPASRTDEHAFLEIRETA